RWFTPLRRTALKRVKVTTSVGVQQVPAKRQNRGPGNSTGDGFLKAKQVQKEGQHERGAGGFTRRHLYPRTG
ncbi:hypothetical protein SBS95_25830, partial [Klebsiella pneumoniae]|nr:hypothetical protein [Klebsiella pneumoniae]